VAEPANERSEKNPAAAAGIGCCLIHGWLDVYKFAPQTFLGSELYFSSGACMLSTECSKTHDFHFFYWTFLGLKYFFGGPLILPLDI